MYDHPDERLCPPEIRESLIAYRDKGIPTGGFLRAVLANDLMLALGKADDNNRPVIHHIAAWIYKNMPLTALKSYDKVDAWIAKHAEIRKAVEAEKKENQ